MTRMVRVTRITSPLQKIAKFRNIRRNNESYKNSINDRPLVISGYVHYQRWSIAVDAKQIILPRQRLVRDCSDFPATLSITALRNRPEIERAASSFVNVVVTLIRFRRRKRVSKFVSVQTGCAVAS